MSAEFSKADIRAVTKELKSTELAKKETIPKTILSIRIDSDLKELLEVIAAREDRTVSNQALRMLKIAIENYIVDNGLFIEPERNSYDPPSLSDEN